MKKKPSKIKKKIHEIDPRTKKRKVREIEMDSTVLLKYFFKWFC